MSTLWISHRIPPEFFEQARSRAAQERAKAMAQFFATLGRVLRSTLKPRRARDVAFRFQNHGLWRGI